MRANPRGLAPCPTPASSFHSRSDSARWALDPDADGPQEDRVGADAAIGASERARVLALTAASVSAALSDQRGGELAGTLVLCATLAAIGRIDWECRLVFPQLLATGHAAALGLALLGSRAVPP
jgi:hypothetical protein